MGAYTDPTRLLYLINRYYDPTTDQFLSVDPEVARTDQPYVFTNDEPLNAEDPLGNDPPVIETAAELKQVQAEGVQIDLQVYTLELATVDSEISQEENIDKFTIDADEIVLQLNEGVPGIRAAEENTIEKFAATAEKELSGQLGYAAQLSYATYQTYVAIGAVNTAAANVAFKQSLLDTAERAEDADAAQQALALANGVLTDASSSLVYQLIDFVKNLFAYE